MTFANAPAFEWRLVGMRSSLFMITE